jgi:hypothetical protein
MAVIVKVSDLIKRLKEVRNDGIREVSISAYDDEGDEDFPPHIHIDGLDPDNPNMFIDYEDIDGRKG